MVEDGSCERCDDYYQPTPDLKECEPLAGNILISKIIELEDANRRETDANEKYQVQNDALQNVVRDQSEDKKLMAADNDGCIIENEALSQANKILFEQCKDEKGKLNDGYSEL